MKRRPEINLALIQNFISYFTHSSKPEDGEDEYFKELVEMTPEQIYQAALKTKQSNVYGYDAPEEYCIQLWLDAEELSKNGEPQKATLIKEKFIVGINKSWVDKSYVEDILERSRKM